jgi:O-acetyl-ADP-ribose deacetylase (regulator of RNase III)
MLEIQYLEGDATYPEATGNKMIVHVCNNKGGWGKGFVKSLSTRWYQPERSYREWYKDFIKKRSIVSPSTPPFALGEVQFVPVEPGIKVANMLAQAGFNKYTNIPPIRYKALRNCLVAVDLHMQEWGGGSIHMPRIGCGLAGGSWEKVEPLIQRFLVERGHLVYVYDLPK